MTGLEALFFGAPAIAATATAPAVAATSGLIGTAGSFALAPALMTAGTVAGGLGALSAGAAGSQAGKFNAQLAERDAIMAQQATAFELRSQRKRAQQFLGSERAKIGASGVNLEGSPLLTQSENAYELELDDLATQYSGSVAEARARSQAAQARMQGAAARRGGYFGAGTTLLTGVGKRMV